MDEEARQLILLLDKRAAERDRRFQQSHEAIMARFARLDEKSDELMAEARAHRKALFSILDRLDNGGGAAPA